MPSLLAYVPVDQRRRSADGTHINHCADYSPFVSWPVERETRLTRQPLSVVYAPVGRLLTLHDKHPYILAPVGYRAGITLAGVVPRATARPEAERVVDDSSRRDVLAYMHPSRTASSTTVPEIVLLFALARLVVCMAQMRREQRKCGKEKKKRKDNGVARYILLPGNQEKNGFSIASSLPV